MATYTCNLAC